MANFLNYLDLNILNDLLNINLNNVLHSASDFSDKCEEIQIPRLKECVNVVFELNISQSRGNSVLLSQAFSAEMTKTQIIADMFNLNGEML